MSPRMAAIALVAIGTLLEGCSNDYERQVLGTLERDRLELIAESDEPIIEIAVTEGQAVEPGQVLLRQQLGAMQARLDRAKANVRRAEQRLRELVSGPRAQEIMEARAALEAAESELETQSNEYRRIEDLVERKLLSQSALDQQRARRDNASGARKQAAARLQLLLEGTRVEEVEQAQAALEEAKAQLLELETSAERYTVKAPRAGRIEAIPYKSGERPVAGAPVIVMLADGVPYARVYIPEPRRLEFRPGTRVQVRVDGRAEPLEGVVRFVSADAAFTPYYALTQEDRSRLSYLAEIDLAQEAAADIPTGLPVQVMLGEQQ
ncbi:MAG TPA: HlyD family efflux transporter periplasmic adaptor subunit [Steroidobacter sp.]